MSFASKILCVLSKVTRKIYNHGAIYNLKIVEKLIDMQIP